MKICKNLIILFLLPILFSCNNKYRNKIELQHPISEVQDSIIKITSLLEKIRDPIAVNKEYDYREGNLFVNNKQTNLTNIDTINALSKLTSYEKKEFLKLSRYLKLNDLTSGSYDTYLKLWVFEYRYLPNGNNSDTRVIAILNKDSISKIVSKVVILDQKQMIYLLKYK